MFISFEGGEGSGKTTLIQRLKERFEKRFEVVVTREPGGCTISEGIREIILNKAYTMMSAKTEALLYAASRVQHLDEVIIPALKANQLILCDRYLDSSLAYQAYARGLGFDYVLAINEYALNYLPDVTFYIDVEPKIGIDRIQTRGKIDRLDSEKMEFHERIRKGYLEVIKMYPKRVIYIDGHQTIDDIETEILKHIAL